MNFLGWRILAHLASLGPAPQALSIKALCDTVARDRSTVLREIRALEQAGYLAVARGPGGRGHKNKYTVLPVPSAVPVGDAETNRFRALVARLARMGESSR